MQTSIFPKPENFTRISEQSKDWILDNVDFAHFFNGGISIRFDSEAKTNKFKSILSQAKLEKSPQIERGCYWFEFTSKEFNEAIGSDVKFGLLSGRKPAATFTAPQPPKNFI